jgi:hypothetical protein
MVISSESGMVGFVSLPSKKELKKILKRTTNIRDQETIKELYSSSIENKLEEMKWQSLPIDFTCMPICHFNPQRI